MCTRISCRRSFFSSRTWNCCVFDLEPPGVLFRSWECFHSIRELNFASILMFEIFSTFPKNIFSVDPKKYSENFRKFSEISKFSKILTKFIKGNFRKISLYKFSKDFWKFWDFRNFPQNFSENYFWIDRKNIFRKSWKFFRTSRSMQNLLADRMEALSASEKHWKNVFLVHTTSLQCAQDNREWLWFGYVPWLNG